ncbi:MAG: HAD-IC family P-type ATPase [Oscillospiraceae bacterium]
MAASFLKRKPKEPERPQRVEIPAVEADPELGLTGEQVHERLAGGWDNRPVEPPGATVQQIIVKNVCTYFNFLFFLLAGCVIAVRQWLNLTFLGPVFCNMFIGIVQDLRVKKKVDNLRIMSAPKCRAVRDGQIVQTEAAALVRDDIAVFGPGDQIPADAVVAAGECHVNEALVTGEADEIVKRPGDALLSGSFVVSGSCRARLTKVGADSFVSRLTIEARQTGSQPQSEMMRSLTSLIKWIGFLVIPLGAVMFIKEYLWLKSPVADAVTSTVGSIVGMIPEGLYLLTSLALVASVIRLGQPPHAGPRYGLHRNAGPRRHALRRQDWHDHRAQDDRRRHRPPQPDRYIADDIRMIMADYVCAMQDDNDTMAALRRYFTGQSMQTAIAAMPFRSAKKYGGVSFYEDETYLLGAPEILLAACPERRTGSLPQAEEWSAKGCRVLLLALYDGKLDDEALTAEMMPLALILLSNKIRPEAPQTFAYFAQQGVRTKVISGDNPLTVSEVARRAGIPDAEKFVDARTLKTDAELAKAAEEMTVFGRVTPDQKKKLVAAMKRAGHTVAMTGDGVNDVLALREADCSIAMASGSGVACQASHIVLLDSQFSALPSVVAEGRRVINNIERSASLYLVKNIFTFVLSLITLFFTLPYPYTPAQLSLVNALTIGIPSFVLAMEPNENRISGKFMRNVIFRALPAALTDLVLVVGVMLFYLAFHIREEMLSTICTGIMGVVGLLMVYQTSQPFNKLRKAMMIGLTAVFALCYFFLPNLFTLSALDNPSLLILVVLGLLAFSVMFVCRKGLNAAKAQLSQGRRPLRRRKREDGRQ